MIIENIKLINWRNWKEASFDFGPGINLIIGNNARGKTNILEAIVFLAITKSWRVKNDRSLVRFEADFSKLIANFCDGEKNINEELRLIKKDKNIVKEIRIDGILKKMIEVLGQLRVVYFSPEEIEKFFFWPNRRRRWIDILLSVVDYSYAYDAAMYKKVVINRNSLLKKINLGLAKMNELAFWDKKWEELVLRIVEKRKIFVEFVNRKANEYFEKLFVGGGNLQVEYIRANWQERGVTLIEFISGMIDKELRYGSTLIGPHRDDVIVKLQGKKIDQIGSRAQMRLALLSLKMAEADYIFQEKQNYPILLLDDIFSELDEINKKKVIEYVQDKQTIITTTEIDKMLDLSKIVMIKVE
ncbi:MAG: DNA replication/repair protein RecF [Patescibacteria group bacterium]